jgi:c-di-GMP-binding flagellar brake protein YcgR
MAEEKRKYPRVPIYNVISYICLDEDGHPSDEGMGTTVNVSQGGVLIETSRPVDSQSITLMIIDHDKNMLEIKGRVAYRRELGSTKFLTGIQFTDTAEAVKKILKHFITDYHRQKKKSP